MSSRFSSSLRSLLSAAIAFGGTVLFARGALADVTVNFDNLTPDTAVNTQYVNVDGQSGVQFAGVTGKTGPYIFTGGVTAASGPNVLINSRIDEEFSGGPIRGTFIMPQKTVGLLGSYYRFNATPATQQGTLRGYDAAGNVILTDGPKMVTGGNASTPFSIASTQANIASFSLDIGSSYTIIDNLQFGGGATVPPPASGPPVVTITDPSNVVVDATNSGLLVKGSVAGDSLLPKVNVVIQLNTPPPVLGPTQVVQSATLDLTAPNNAFQNNTVFRNLLMGFYTVTVTATNQAGQIGTSTKIFVVMPASLSGIPGFQFAQASGNCQIAVFGSTAAALFPSTGATTIIPSIIVNKWLQVRDYPALRGDGMLGCPIAEATPNATIPLSKRIAGLHTQDFERGRIYALEPFLGGASSYTPRVFADAITAISTYSDPGAPAELQAFDDPAGTTEVGIPVGPPIMDAFGTDPTWLFQRFARVGYDGTPNTIELRGPNASPKLYIERVGGGMSDYVTAIGQLPVRGDPTATVWETFDCQFSATIGQWQCSVVHPHVKAVTAKTQSPMYTTRSVLDRQDDFCPPTVDGYGAFVPSKLANSWAGVPLKDEDALDQEPSIADVTDVLASGFIKGTYRSNTDLSTVHWHTGCDHTSHDAVDLGCDAVVSSLTGGGGSCGDYGSALGDFVTGCWSDYVIHIRPLAINTVDPNGTLLRIPSGVEVPPPYWSLLAANGDPTLEGVDSRLQIGDIESEWEMWWQLNFTDIMQHFPLQGSLAILNGRWIIDCGHPPFHSEIHPPNGIFLLEMASPPPALAPTTGPDGVVTRTQVWVNEFYEGHPFNVSIWPPPRPTPNAQLNALYTVYNAPANGIVFQPDGSVVTSFTNYPVTDDLIVSPDTSHVTLRLGPDGAKASFAGPGGSHAVRGTGQAIFPRDSTSETNGTVGRLLAQWYVGWTQ